MANAGALPSSTAPQRGMLGTLQGIVREEGLRRLYRGLTPACLRHCVYSGIRVGAYEFLREHVFLREEDGSFPLWKVCWDHCMWVCGCVGVWVCGCVGVWVCGCVGVWVCGCVGVVLVGILIVGLVYAIDRTSTNERVT